MTKIAIDVVLLPSDEMMDTAIKINKELLKTNENTILLDKETCIPHMSLCIGCIEEKKLPEIRKILEFISKEFSSMNLVAEKLNAEVTPAGKKISVMNIKKIQEIQSLHEMVMKKLWPYLSFNADVSMLFHPPEIEEVTLYWIKEYAKHYDTPDLFHPHVTIGFGESDAFKFPINFATYRLALCQLGNYCTCRRILTEFPLRN